MKISIDDKVAVVVTEESIVSNKLITLLLKHSAYKAVKLFSPSQPDFEHEKLSYFHYSTNHKKRTTLDFSGDDLFCFLDIKRPFTTTPSDVKIRQLYSYQIAKIAATSKVNQLLFLSSSAANRDSLNQKSRIRAYLEESLFQLPFWAVHIFRPPAVVDTEGKSQWGAEVADKIKTKLDQVTNGMVSKYQPVEALQVATVMLDSAQQLRSGAFLYKKEYFQDWQTKSQLLE